MESQDPGKFESQSGSQELSLDELFAIGVDATSSEIDAFRAERQASEAILKQTQIDKNTLSEYDEAFSEESIKATAVELLDSPNGFIAAAELIAGRPVSSNEVKNSLGDIMTSTSTAEMKYLALVEALRPR